MAAMQTSPAGGDRDLPRGEDLDIIALAQSLDKVNTSYKFLWLLSLLEIVGEAGDEDAELTIPMRDVAMRMLKGAEHPVRTYKLYLGKDDRMEKYIKGIDEARSAGGPALPGIHAGQSQQVRAAQDEAFRNLREFVPQQWLVPFLARRGLNLPTSSTARSKEILRIMSGPNALAGLPYRFAGSRKGSDVVIDRGWRRYFKRHNEIVRGWAMYRFVAYVQARNPHIPGIVAKLAHPEERNAITAERKWWKAMMGEMDGIRCIYSGKPLQPNSEFDLDHFVPWSFVGHNRLWNLVPVAPEVNSAKSDRLPSKKYLERLVAQQQRALEANAGYRSRKGGKWKWGLILDAYVVDLRLDISGGAPDFEKTAKAYRQVVPPLLSLAASRGFERGWTFRRAKAA